MHISFNWLKTLVAIDLSPEDLAHQLTLAGFEVEDIEDRKTWAEGVVVGYVRDCQPHPNANKLSVCQVEVGDAEAATIVCGAPNVKTGLYVPVARPGTYLPCIDLKIKPAKLRGVKSFGMICSLAELGLAKESAGIHSFDPAVQSFQVGDDVRPLLGLDDVILDLTSTANRADALSMVGIAREVAALTGGTLSLPEVKTDSSWPQDPGLSVAIADPAHCPAYLATRVDNIQVGPSPDWLRTCLESAGIRAINNVVDITNYILITWGQPLHAFDRQALETIAGGTDLQIGVRLADDDPPLRTLDGQSRQLEAQNLLITVQNKPVALAGVMGGEQSEVNAQTQSIILECALFNAVSIRRSARVQGLRTEASSRYERGVNPAQLDVACQHALALLADLAGGTVVSQAKADYRTLQQRTILLRLERVNQILGPVWGQDEEPVDLEASQVLPILESLGFRVTPEDDPQIWSVEIPAHRQGDIEREIDLIEEIARLYGYDNFCDTLPAKSEFGYLGEDEVYTRKIRQAFRGAGLTELIHYSWTKPGGDRQISVINPLLIEFSALRTEMLTALIKAFRFNLEQGNGPLNGFEIGRIFWEDEQGLQESPAIAGIMGGDVRQGTWAQDSNRDSPMSWFEAKGILEAALTSLGLSVEYQPDRQDDRLHPGRTASLWIQGQRLGRLGQIHPLLRQDQDLPDAVYCFELDLAVLLDAMADIEDSQIHFQPFSPYPAVDRDLAFFISTGVSVAEISRVIQTAAQKSNASLLNQVDLIDEYQGETVPAGQRSLAFRLVYRAPDRTLTEEEVNPLHQRIREALEAKLSVSLRS
ncbi:phenylalanine--tRNA ligase subunit beta [Lyngbya confervoides]|uniref:Phenylalanine--tRNA ligase beta subunit n=1 Tax=Lyngbya confervoides BDU141951 TaxID=1574623 RepID=A0ABD4T8Q3_9CYAN|nr:phenylalanine--tRNA ligase subunit beta [Lyngbya confervoides]MCM1985026.1 phenylalanine--tRNA ligase subunit beta [Lyngbya confervoides BDU141951]